MPSWAARLPRKRRQFYSGSIFSKVAQAVTDCTITPKIRAHPEANQHIFSLAELQECMILGDPNIKYYEDVRTVLEWIEIRYRRSSQEEWYATLRRENENPHGRIVELVLVRIP